MKQKRGLFTVVFILTLLFIPTFQSQTSSPEEGGLFFTDEQGNLYAYGLAVGPEDDDGEGGCEAGAGSTAPFSVPFAQVFGNSLSLAVREEADELATIAEIVPGVYNDLRQRCSWKNLPTSEQGCYFLADEWDGDGGLNDNHGDTPDDCSGWFIPEGAEVNGQTLTGQARFFTSAAPAGESGTTPPSATGGLEYNFINRLGGAEALGGNFINTGEVDTGGTDNSLCIFNEYAFGSSRPEEEYTSITGSLAPTYRCIEKDNQYRWYICDENNVYDTTGKFIPIEPVSECDSTVRCPEGTCQNNVCVDEAGQPIQTDKTAWICEKNLDGTYTWNGAHPLTCADLETLGESCHADEQVCNSGGFSWLETNEESYCCGYNGIEDLGLRKKNPDHKNYICLNKDAQLVGREGDQSTIANCIGEGNWCWLEAAGQDQAFHIFTIKKPSKPTYDVVSNNNDWYICDGTDGEGTKDISAAGAVFNPEDVDDANRFYCYKEGNRWSWADCLNSNEPVGPPSVNGIKERIEGDGLFALKLSPPDSAGAGQDVVSVDMSAYTNSRLDLVKFNQGLPLYLEFYVRFKRLHAASLQLKILGPQQGGQYVVYYNQPVLGYAVNTPLLEENRWIHLKVPLVSDLLDVKSISIESFDNLIEVRNMYLSDGSSLLCSGTRSSHADDKSWLDNLDYSSPSISGKHLCNVLFDPAYEPVSDPSAPYQGKAWLGDIDSNLDLADHNCCGNGNPENEAEYYAGPSRLVDGKYYGCWNSEPIASGDTTMNVEFGVEYMESRTEITYPEVPVDYILTYIFPGFEETKTGSNTVSLTESPKQIEELELNFAEPSTGDRKWGRIKADGDSQGVRGTIIDPVPPSFDEFVSQVSLQPVIEHITVREPGYTPQITGTTAIFETGGNTDFWIAWMFAKNDFQMPIHISSDDSLGIALASGCNKAMTEGEPYTFDATRCRFSTNPARVVLNQGDTHSDWENNDRYVYWQDSAEGAVNLEFKKGWNVLYFILDDDEGGAMHFSYYPAFFQDDNFIENNPNILYFDSHGPQSIYPTGIKVAPTSESSEPAYDLNLHDLLHVGDISDEFANLQGTQTFTLIAETNKVDVSAPDISTQQKTFTFSCPSSTQSECSYPLPGEHPYTITNSHPDLYELYFIGINEDGQTLPEKLITPSTNPFETAGMIQARKVAQQVVFINEGEEADEDPIFYGCQAAKFLEENVDDPAIFEIVPYCDARAGKFCAYSATKEDGREKFTTINSWSDEAITKVGYAPIDQVEGDVNNFYDSTELQLRDLRTDMPYEEAPIERNFSSSVLPTRNFISNVQFLRSAMAIPHWDIRNQDGTQKENLRNNLVNDELHSITLESGETLRSEQIAVPANTKLSFSATTTCTPTINLVDKDGVVVPITVPTSFNTGSASYLQLEFPGPCTLHSPLLQVVDDLPPVSFNYKHQEYLDGFDARAGAACCPQNYCWNGYACVEPMGSSTYLAEHIADGRDYRCIEGQWKHLPLQFDWNKEKWGFCAQPEQCLVLPSTLGGSADYSALDFYDGHYPTCINNGEYVFDNLCNNGNWTSRTKFVATKLLEVGENSDYVLYCTNYRQALLEFDNRENYLGGEFVQQPQTAPTLTETLQGPTTQAGLSTCFNSIQDPQGRRLVSDEENTCINNVCVLRFKQGGDFKVAFATTVNKDILKEDSFLFSLNIPQNRLNQLCSGTGDFVKCDLAGLNIPGDLWYSKTLNATIYGKQGIQITPTVVDRILNWLARFVGVQSELSDESAFISRAQNFRDVYVLSIGDKKVRALKEVLSADKQTLIAEYEHFNTPVCDYVKNIAVPPEAQTELLEQLSGQQKIICSGNATGIQRVEAIAGLDFFWPQLTGRLRVG